MADTIESVGKLLAVVVDRTETTNRQMGELFSKVDNCSSKQDLGRLESKLDTCVRKEDCVAWRMSSDRHTEELMQVAKDIRNGGNGNVKVHKLVYWALGIMASTLFLVLGILVYMVEHK